MKMLIIEDEAGIAQTLTDILCLNDHSVSEIFKGENT